MRVYVVCVINTDGRLIFISLDSEMIVVTLGL